MQICKKTRKLSFSYVEKYIIRKISGISTVSTVCGKLCSDTKNKMSTIYPQIVDNVVMHRFYSDVKTKL